MKRFTDIENHKQAERAITLMIRSEDRSRRDIGIGLATMIMLLGHECPEWVATLKEANFG